jgi:hypothetical protein
MNWVDRALAVRLRTLALIGMLLGLVTACMAVGVMLATGAFAGMPVGFTCQILGVLFLVLFLPWLIFGLGGLLLDAAVKRHGEFAYLCRSAVVREIHEHLTGAEKVQLRRLMAASGIFGGLLAAGLCCGFGETPPFARPAVVALAALSFAGLTVFVPRKHKRFLASTQYAREKGMEAGSIPLWQWPTKRTP